MSPPDQHVHSITELELNSDPALLAQVFDRIAIAAFVIDRDHRVIYWNGAIEALSGLRRSDIIGTSDHWKPFYQEPRPCLADLIIEGGKDEDVERYYKGKYRASDLIPEAYEAEDFFPECGDNGEWLHFTAATLRNSKGEVIGALETLMNISARKKAEFELIERERIYRDLSITDALTGLHNSRYFYDRLENSMENAKRYKHGFSLCFLDLDNFKQLNDTYGHMFGDQVLETFGTLIKASLRTTDTAFRYGGEEFAIILPSTDACGAELLANRIRKSLNDHSFPVNGGDVLHISTSVGVTEYREGDNAKRILNRADKALYDAKDAGRNTTCVRLADT
jgi:diguanylate cyclase (GGDEF)-like protein/PAS domain S-box-containing protein